ncbi:MAG: YraN family protein [Candidatus Margulisbacteria bacterium]|jgi:putative endonuclease|nr:YraN family protein [Candidatus Margulisiibacteriota bacterium]
MRELGYAGEQIAAEYLSACGYKIIARNYTRKHGEIDIIARDKKVLAFIEVKYYKVNSLRELREAVTPAQQKRLIRTAARYLQEQRITDSYVRFDAVLITHAGTGIAPKLELIKDAFRA